MIKAFPEQLQWSIPEVEFVCIQTIKFLFNCSAQIAPLLTKLLFNQLEYIKTTYYYFSGNKFQSIQSKPKMDIFWLVENYFNFITVLVEKTAIVHCDFT